MTDESQFDTTYNDRAVSLTYLAEAMELSKTDARRALTGIHHNAHTPTPWADESGTRPCFSISHGSLPESETGIHRYHYYVD